jgi:hypothetical protein
VGKIRLAPSQLVTAGSHPVRQCLGQGAVLEWKLDFSARRFRRYSLFWFRYSHFSFLYEHTTSAAIPTQDLLLRRGAEPEGLDIGEGGILIAAEEVPA